MKKIGVVITDGVGFRNFVLSEFLKEVSKSFDEITIYSGLPKESYKVVSKPENIKIEELNIFRESRTSWFFRKLKEVAHMTLHKNYFGINNNLKRGYPKNNSKRAISIKLIYIIAKLFHSEKAIQFYESQQFKSFKNDKVTKEYLKLLKRDQPNILFFTHQRPPYLAPMVYAAQQLQITTSSFIFSWDNLASKGRMMGAFDNYLVWSDLMKTELQYFYPQSNNNNISVIGTPQFEPYVMDEYRTRKDNFYEKFDLLSNKKVICYSCADAGIGANDPIHIKAIHNFIEKNPELDLQLLVRTSPAEDGSRFQELKQKYPKIKWNIPKWVLTRDNHIESWSQRIPSVEDVKDLRAILEFSDVNVNMCSTMGLDFMLFDKPVIYTVFGNENSELYNDQLFLNYVHLTYVIDSEAVAIAKNFQDLDTYLKEAIKKPELRKTYREELIALEIGKTLKGTSERLAKQLESWA